MTNEADRNQSRLLPPSDLNPRTDAALDFPDRAYGELTADDYRALGFMAGLEVHQQLDTRSKLFCRCPAGRRVSVYDAEVLRHMRPTLSELGEYDGTALMEFKTRKEIVYQLHRGTVCTYEIDDTPPFEIDEQAVRIALEISLQLNLNLVSELHVMRKQYLDGSIPTGFQRTAMVGLTGTIPFRVPEIGVDRELRIRQLSLEEDSCREISDIGHRITFHTDRLGIPLTEAVTEPDLFTPLELQAAGRLLARVARATGKVRRGPGAARQDVNVSVAGGRRTEIKGVDNHRGLPQLVHIEAFRQLNLLRIKAELERRGVTASMLSLPDKGLPWEVSDLVVEAGPALRSSDFAPIRDARERRETVCAVRLPGFAGLLSHRTQPGVTFAREFADRVRVIACPEHRPFMIHSDIHDYGLDPRHWRALRKQSHARSGDALVVVWGQEDDAATAAREVLIRARDALEGVPAETRQAFADGSNGFERILPGANRMYPDTDTPPLPIPDTLVADIRKGGLERPWEREGRYQQAGLSFDAARRLAAAPWADLFDELDPGDARTASRVANALAKRLPHHWRHEVLQGLPDAGRLAPLVRALEAGEVRHEATEPILDELIVRIARPADELLDRYRKRTDDAANLGVELERVRSISATVSHKPVDARMRWGMGELMRRFVGRLDPRHVRQQLDEDPRRAGPGEPIVSASANDKYKGYRGPCRELMEQQGVTVWSEVIASTSRGRFEGLLLPRSETSDDKHIVLKLVSGYNVGLRHDTIESLEQTGYREAHYKIPEQEFPTDPAHPCVKLFGTGGTIASRLDYRTGAVIPAFSPGELYGSVPELADICNLETEKLFGVFSENMGPEQYLILARADRRGDRRRLRRHRDRPRHRHDAPHRRRAELHGAEAADPDRDGRQPAIVRSALFRCRAEPDQRHLDRGAWTDRRGRGLHVRADLRSLQPAPSWYPRAQDAQLLPQHLPHAR